MADATAPSRATVPLESVLEIVIDADGRYVAANDAMLELTGYSHDELRELPIGSMAPPETRDAAVEVWADVVAGVIEPPAGHLEDLYAKDGRVFRVRVVEAARRPDGRFVSRSTLVSRRRIDLGRPEALHEILAQWRHAEARLAALLPGDAAAAELVEDVRELRELYESEVERLRPSAIAGAHVHIDRDGRYTDPSDEFLELLRVERDVVEGAEVGIFGQPATRQAALDTFRQFVASGEPVAVSKAVLVRGDGTQAAFRATTCVDPSDPGRYIAWFEAIPVPLGEPPTFRTAAEALRQWRDAERELAAMSRTDPRWFDALYRVALLRAEYQRMVAGIATGAGRP